MRHGVRGVVREPLEWAMARSKLKTGSHQSPDRIRAAAVILFNSRGYHGTSVRDLAKAVNIEPASLYYHYPSKQKILVDLFVTPMEEMLEGIDLAVREAATARDRLRAAVRFHVLFHIARQNESSITHSELRSLTPRNRRMIIANRDRYERKFRALLEAGVKTGDFKIPDVKLTAIALLTMCSGVSDWFVRRGRLAPTVVADRYADMAMLLVKAR
jgi:AcrR family transcriptional regulator